MTITINDKPYRLVWGMGAIEIYCDLMECDIEGLAYLDDNTNAFRRIKAITTMVFAAIKNGCEIADTDCPVTYRILQNWIDEAEQNTADEIMKDFGQSKIFGKTLASYFGGVQEPETTKTKKKSRSVKS